MATCEHSHQAPTWDQLYYASGECRQCLAQKHCYCTNCKGSAMVHFVGDWQLKDPYLPQWYQDHVKKLFPTPVDKTQVESLINYMYPGVCNCEDEVNPNHPESQCIENKCFVCAMYRCSLGNDEHFNGQICPCQKEKAV